MKTITLVEDSIDKILNDVREDLPKRFGQIHADFVTEQKDNFERLLKEFEDGFISPLILEVHKLQQEGKHCNIETWNKIFIPEFAENFSLFINLVIEVIREAETNGSVSSF